MNIIEELLKQFAEKSGQNKPLLPGQPAGGTPPFVPPMRKPVPPMQNAATPAPPPQQAPASNDWTGDFAGEKRPLPPLQEVKPNVTGKHLQDIKPQGVMHLRDIETPDRGDPKQKWFKKPFHKDNDRMAMMFSALSDGFGGMTMSGKSGMSAMNKANYAKGMEGVQNNKTMKYLINNKPELAKKLMEIAPEHRDQFMEQAMKSQFEGAGKQSAFAEKVAMYKAANPAATDAEALDWVRGDSGTNVTVNNGGSSFADTLGKQAGDWYTKQSGAYSNINDMERVVGTIEAAIENGDQLSGGIINFMPDDMQDLFAPQAQDVRRSVEKVIQSSLKETLGAQFTEREGENVIKRTWNPQAPIEYNLRRTKQLLNELKGYAAGQDQLLDGMLSSNGNIM